MITFRTASPSDNKQLVELTRLTPMQGNISICIEREPDFFALLNKKGEPHVIIAEENNVIVGCVSIVKEEMMLLGQPTTFHYLCDLKVHPDYRNKKVATMMCHEMHKYLLQNNADWLLSIVAKGNTKVMPLMYGKAGIEGGDSLGIFIIHQLLPKKHIRLNEKYQYSVTKNVSAVTQAHKEFHKRYLLHPSICEESLQDCIHIAAFENDKIVAAISLYDANNLKQNVVISLPWYLHMAVKGMRLVKPLLKFPVIPRIGKPIRILYAKAYSFLPGYEDAFIYLIQYARMYAYQKKYTFFSITFHENDKLRSLIKKIPAFTFKSNELICSLKNNSALLHKIKEGNILEDYSLV